MRAAIYRAVFGGYDFAPGRDVLDPAFDYYIFTDDDSLSAPGYQCVFVDHVSDNPSMLNRSYKLKVPSLLNDYQCTVYIDGNIRMVASIAELVNEFAKSGGEIGSFRHRTSLTLRDEVKNILGARKASKHAITGEIAEFTAQELETSVCDNSIILRSKNSIRLEEFGDLWLEWVLAHSGRDQLCFPVLMRRSPIRHHLFPFSPRCNGNGYFIVYPHKAEIFRGSFVRRMTRLLMFLIKEARAWAHFAKSKRGAS